MSIISVLKTNSKLISTQKGVIYSDELNEQKARVNQSGGRPSGSECGNSCSCS